MKVFGKNHKLQIGVWGGGGSDSECYFVCVTIELVSFAYTTFQVYINQPPFKNKGTKTTCTVLCTFLFDRKEAFTQLTKFNIPFIKMYENKHYSYNLDFYCTIFLFF
jgi:hypothetical protein